MKTVFSHIVQKRLSQENENVATEALSYILHAYPSARDGMMKLLRSVAPKLPRLTFTTQQAEGESRPDMTGRDDDARVRVLVENKFWAGLTDNQPVSYLGKLAKCPHPTILLVVCPESRREFLWRELAGRLAEAGTGTTHLEVSTNIVRAAATAGGPVLGLTSWEQLIPFLELEVADDKAATGDLLQLKALCESANSEAFQPFSMEAMSDQRTPALVLQLTGLCDAVLKKAIAEGVLKPGKGNTRQADSTRIGGYTTRLGWLGINFALWKTYGVTPFWSVFYSHWDGYSGVRSSLEAWALKKGVFTAVDENDCFVVAINIRAGEDKDQVVRGIVDQMKEMADALDGPKPAKKVDDV